MKFGVDFIVLYKHFSECIVWAIWEALIIIYEP